MPKAPPTPPHWKTTAKQILFCSSCPLSAPFDLRVLERSTTQIAGRQTAAYVLYPISPRGGCGLHSIELDQQTSHHQNQNPLTLLNASETPKPQARRNAKSEYKSLIHLHKQGNTPRELQDFLTTISTKRTPDLKAKP
jgi:hypothetical protein